MTTTHSLSVSHKHAVYLHIFDSVSVGVLVTLVSYAVVIGVLLTGVGCEHAVVLEDRSDGRCFTVSADLTGPSVFAAESSTVIDERGKDASRCHLTTSHV